MRTSAASGLLVQDSSDPIGLEQLSEILSDNGPREGGAESLSRLLGFWQSVIAEKAQPARQDLSPGDMIFILPNLWMVDCPESGVRRYRLVGTELVSQLGRDVTGQTLRPDQDWRDGVFSALCQQVVRLRGMVVGQVLLNSHFKDEWLFQGAAMPLFDATGKVNIVLGGGFLRPGAAVSGAEPLTLKLRTLSGC